MAMSYLLVASEKRCKSGRELHRILRNGSAGRAERLSEDNRNQPSYDYERKPKSADHVHAAQRFMLFAPASRKPRVVEKEPVDDSAGSRARRMLNWSNTL